MEEWQEPSESAVPLRRGVNIKINVAISSLADRFNVTSTSSFDCHGVELRKVFMLGDDGTQDTLFGEDGKLSSISLTSGFFYKKYNVNSVQSLLKAVDEYFAEGALISSCAH